MKFMKYTRNSIRHLSFVICHSRALKAWSLKFGVWSFVALACLGLLAPQVASGQDALPAGHPPIDDPAKPANASPSANATGIRFSGKVLEATNAGAYTYILVDTGKDKLWAAAPQCIVKPGDAIMVADGMEMPGFHSKTLDRDFDKVYFTGNITINGKSPSSTTPALQSSATPNSADLPKGHPPITGSSTTTKLDLTGIKKAKDGKTIEEIYAGKAKLNGKPVTVRGKVVKYNANILGKNWIHLRDGTGASGSNDLLITTTTPAKVGDIIFATGPIGLNKDFGSNYKYDVIIENAKITVE
jgi:hypothetical protein